MQDKRVILFKILIGMMLLFIWGNSLTPAKQSSEASSKVQEVVNDVIDTVMPDGNKEELHHLEENTVRKLAHFTEFAILGILIFCLNTITGKYKLQEVFGMGLLTGFLDETIQIFIDGRSAEIRDVWIDFLGYSSGLFVIFLIMFLVRKKHK